MQTKTRKNKKKNRPAMPSIPPIPNPGCIPPRTLVQLSGVAQVAAVLPQPTPITTPSAERGTVTTPAAPTLPSVVSQSTEERPHHPYSPSTLQYLEACPCYINRKDVVVNKRCEAGTKAHKVADTQEDDETLGDDDAAAVAECLDLIARRRQLMQEEATRAWMATPNLPETAFQVLELGELYLPIDTRKFEDADCTTGGYTDKTLINYNRTYAELFDWKFGFWAVEKAEDNLQGIAYVLGLFRKFHSLRTIRFFFKQPHLEYITEYLFYRTDIPRLYLRVVAVVERARKGRAEAEKGNYDMANPVIPACLFCGNIARCTKVTGFVCKVGQKFSPVEFPANLDPWVVQDAHNSDLGLRLAGVVAAWAKAFRSTLTERVLRGDADMPTGQKLQEMPGHRKIVDIAKFREAALKWLTEQEYLGTLEATFGKVEELISDKAPRGDKTAQVKEFGKLLEKTQAVERGSGYVFLRACSSEKTEKQNT